MGVMRRDDRGRARLSSNRLSAASGRFGAGEQPGRLVLTAVDNAQSSGCPSQQSASRKPIRRRMVFYAGAVDDRASVPLPGDQARPGENGQMRRERVVRTADRLGDRTGGEPVRFLPHEEPKYPQPDRLAERRKCGEGVRRGHLAACGRRPDVTHDRQRVLRACVSSDPVTLRRRGAAKTPDDNARGLKYRLFPEISTYRHMARRLSGKFATRRHPEH